MSKTLTVLITVFIAIMAFQVMRHMQKPAAEIMSSSENSLPEAANNTPTEFHKWREFISPAGHFKALFPALPQHATDTFIDPKTKERVKYDTFVAADDRGQAFMISSIAFPRNIDDSNLEETLKGVINDMLMRNKDNKLKMMNMGNFRQFSGLDFSLTNGEVVISGKVFAHEDTLYVISLITKDEVSSAQELDFFVNSFSITGDSNIKAPTKK